jgi:hypothetical protein
MENSFQTSFIPKKPIVGTSVVVSSRSSTSIFTVLSVIILFVAGASAGGLFLYKNYLTTQIENLSSSIVKAQDNFDKDTIKDLELFDKRASTAKTVLKSHIVLSPIFKMIADVTIPQVQYTKFEHQNSDSGFNVKMSGIASDYKSVALQSDVFNSAKGRNFKNVVFSNITKEKGNNISFNIEFNIDPSLLSFENVLSGSKTTNQNTPTQPAVNNTVNTTNQNTPNISNTLNQPTPNSLTPNGSNLPNSNITQ